MADPLQQLVPAMAPPPPDPQAATVLAWSSNGQWVLLTLGMVALAWFLGTHFWPRIRLYADLRNLPAEDDPPQAAQHLVALVRRHQLQPTPDWWQQADALRFRPFSPEAAALLLTLRKQIPSMKRRP